jgi:Methylamine utilisation protein MauE
MGAIDPVIGNILRGLLALVLAEAAYHKASDFRAFCATLANYRLVPESLNRSAALSIVTIEIVAAVGLLWPGATDAAPSLAAVIFLAYGAAIAANLIRGRRDIDCGCSGPAVRQSLSEGLVFRNIALAACCWVATLDQLVRPLGVLDTGTVLFGVAGLFLIYVASNRLRAESAHFRAALNHDE